MTLEVAGAMVIGLLLWNIWNLYEITKLEDKVAYLKGQVETLIRRKPTETDGLKHYDDGSSEP